MGRPLSDPIAGGRVTGVTIPSHWEQPGFKPNRYAVKLFSIGTIATKDTIFARLKTRKPRPGCVHFSLQGPEGADAEYLAQFEAEQIVRGYSHGWLVRRYKQIRTRNEAIDLEVLAVARSTRWARASAISSGSWPSSSTCSERPAQQSPSRSDLTRTGERGAIPPGSDSLELAVGEAS